MTGGGLSAALPELAGRTSVPVELRVKTGCFAAAVEACAYFVCAEALTNVAEYASRVQIDVGRDGDWLAVVVADDGAGGG